MKKIENAAVIGMGALGMLYGSRLMTTLGRDNVKFLMDSGRLKRHSGDTYTVNGTTVSFTMEDAALAGPQDLVILAVKYPALQEALREMAPAVGRDSILMSVMNGITSHAVRSSAASRSEWMRCGRAPDFTIQKPADCRSESWKMARKIWCAEPRKFYSEAELHVR